MIIWADIYWDNYAKVKLSFKYANWFYWVVNVLFGDELFGYIWWPRYWGIQAKPTKKKPYIACKIRIFENYYMKFLTQTMQSFING